MSDRPVILIGSPNDARSVGDGAANGGVKSQNLWVQLLREHGYEAYFVTHDGSQVQWMVKHAPVVSIETVRQWKAEGRPLKGLTTWLWSASFFDVFDRYYLYDEEIAFTAQYDKQRGLLEQHLAQNRIIKLGTHSRLQAGWYLGAYGLLPEYIPEWSDGTVFYPDASERVPHRIGFFDEDGQTAEYALRIARVLSANDLKADMICVGGSESQVRDALQTCDILLGMNQGKWRSLEGCPRGQQEAMHCGAVLVSFDVGGNYEYLTDGYTGYMVENGHVDAMALRVVQLLKDPSLLEAMRQRSIDFAMNAFVPENRWAAVRDFLDLTD